MKDVISNNNMRESDAYTIEHYIPSRTLMWNAALGVYNNVVWDKKVYIVCGKGNNGGDGFALSLILKEHNIESHLVLIDEPVTSDAIYYFNKTKEVGIRINNIDEIEFESNSIIVDAIFGTGFNGTPKNKYAYAINKINNANAYRVSIDINSGLNGDNGLGELIVNSDLTIAIGQYKYGHFLNVAKDSMKKLVCVDIDIKPIYKDALLIEDSDIKSFFVPRKHFSNKGTYGYVGILGGSSKYPGAVRLASLGQSALYSGAGVSKLIVPRGVGELIYPLVLETTICLVESNNGDMVFNKHDLDEAINGLKVLGIGIGWGNNEHNKKILEYILKTVDIPLVIDADGLNVLSSIGLDILNETKAKIILTPHPKEFSRLIKTSVDEVLSNCVSLVKEFVNKYNVTLLLKGPTTIVADKDNIYFIDRGTPGMATAGSGDVLTGIIVGILGQNKEDITYSTSVAAFINGYSGELASKEFGDIGMVSSDTQRCISKAIKTLISNE